MTMDGTPISLANAADFEPADAANVSLQNTLTSNDALEALERLSAQRVIWEQRDYRRSNQSLYAILEACLDLYADIRSMKKGKEDVIEKIDERLTELGLKSKRGCDLIVKIVRCVFGDCGKRAFAYARVIRFAYAGKSDHQSLAAYIAGKGGIEEIRKTTNVGAASPRDLRKKSIETAAKELFVMKPLINLAALTNELKTNNAKYPYSVALIRTTSGGSGNIVFGSTNLAIVKTLLAEAGRKLENKAQVASANDQHKNRAATREEIIEAAVSDVGAE